MSDAPQPTSPIANATITQAGPFDAFLDEDVIGVPLFADEFIDADDEADVALNDDAAARLANLEAVVMAREARRVKRKVAAATTGAGATGFIPLALQLFGVYDVDPAV